MSHLFNTTMKHVVLTSSVVNGQTGKDLEQVMKIVALVKKEGFTATLPDCFMLLYEVPTRFGSTFTLVERFVKVIPFVPSVVEGQTV